MERKKIFINGIVQGVGFRPFVYREAVNNNIKGCIKNICDGVIIDAVGEKGSIDLFIKSLKSNNPPISQIYRLEIRDEEYTADYNEFKIADSEENGRIETLISPDIAICPECRKELFDSNDDRRYMYPFINCSQCGPRFTIVRNIPYDRRNTTMSEFKMCNDCSREYLNPADRRFHAEPVCCSLCGPEMKLIENEMLKESDMHEVRISQGDMLKKVREYLKGGKIIAVKGIGGFNLICNGKDEKAIDRLRKRKRRPKKPLALMMKDMETALRYCYIDKKEEEILIGSKMPIVLLMKKNHLLPENIGFENCTLGIVMPYSPIHCMMFDDELDVLVFTSGNISGFPRAYKNYEALRNLQSAADYFLIHNREINMPADDSVVMVSDGSETVLRSSRGYAPASIESSISRGILALGSQQKNTLSISSGQHIFMSPYIGDMDTVENLSNFIINMNFLKNMYDIKINTVSYDMHPYYWSSEFLNDKEFDNCRKVGVYHHHAHIVSCMYENHESDAVIGITFDGTGYGNDNNIWGGEFLICDYKNFKRAAHLKYMKMPGNESAVKYPWKMGISLIHDYVYNVWECSNKNYLIDENIAGRKKGHHIKNIDIKSIHKEYDCIKFLMPYINFEKYSFICSMLDKNLNTCLTSSMGRLFDGISSLLGFTGEVTYEGEGAVFLENIAEGINENTYDINEEKCYDFLLETEGDMYIIDLSHMIMQIIDDLKINTDRRIIALRFHKTIVEFTVGICIKLRTLYGINKAALSGGVFQNKILLINIKKRLEEEKFKVLIHHKVPCNDSGISLGQAVAAYSKIYGL